ncbi:restriction endonuclease subunit S [Flavilitoribacter nigricans]|uniref:Restriction endonuclease n=1 Tax=Flavilitoribacter nigricans (strain ATCC 23147 / DSM 23189 / NBRC 102662 / NCIMB 1420 / SS-2) TaxID=1122177 RepID=A0A2D0N9B5_FLAN2|nr:restriction endonuclease subunit S [Flavilitoribacter nigricans]PHN04373.1 restriction endonuclease [Flavilitoribacter nigricans DSM 23189 = NBRC 102662]
MVEEVKIVEGFQQTELGLIPKDWELKVFGDISFMKGRIGWQGLKQAEFTMHPDDPFLITGMNFKDGEIKWDEVYHVPFERYQIAKEIQLKVGDVLMTKDGTIGKLLYIKNIPYPYKATLNSHLLVFRPLNNSYYPLYLYYNLSSSYFKNHIELYKSGTTFFGISQESVSKYLIPLPPNKAEQTAIAIALSDIDALIERLEKLLVKKRNIKQGAIQELLRPKEGWDSKALKEVSYMKGRIGWQGLKQAEFTMNPDQPFLITGMNFKDGAIRWSEVYHVPEDRYEIAKEIQLKEDDVLMTKDGTIGKLLYVSEIPYPHKATLNSHLLVFRPLNGSYNPKFLYYQLDSKLFKDFIELRKTGTTFFGISQEAVGDYQMYLPSPEEQEFVSNTLWAMDEEIEQIETQLSKYKMLKTGMMQELLTGKKRLI